MVQKQLNKTLDEDIAMNDMYMIDLPDELEEFDIDEVGMQHLKQLSEQDFGY